MILPNGNEHVNPDLPVLHSVPEVLHGKFVGEGASVVLKTTCDFLSLLRREELCGRRVIIHNDKGNSSYSGSAVRPTD